MAFEEPFGVGKWESVDGGDDSGMGSNTGRERALSMASDRVRRVPAFLSPTPQYAFGGVCGLWRGGARMLPVISRGAQHLKKRR